MNLMELIDTINAVGIEEDLPIYDCGDSIKLSIFRPEKPSAHLKRKYDPMKNFQIFMETETRRFKPNHLRILLDLHLKRITNEEGFLVLLDALEDIYDGEDPVSYKKQLGSLNFPMALDTAYTNLCLTQLFMTEQEINVRENWKVKPPRAYIMSYIRLINTQEREISWILWGATRHPARKQFQTPPKMRNPRLDEF